MGRVGFQRLAVAGLRLRRTAEHLEYQAAVGQRSGTGRTRGAVDHLAKERQGPGGIPAHRECGRGGGADSGRNRLATRRQDAVEERRRTRRVSSPQPGVGQPTGRAERRSFQGFARPRHEGSEDLGGSAGVPGKKLHPRPADLDRRLPRIPGRGGLRHARRFHRLAAVEQESQQLYPLVPAPVADRGQQQVPAAGPEPALLVAREQPLSLRSEVGVRILGQQLPEAEANGRLVR